jgi:hypothetical protein
MLPSSALFTVASFPMVVYDLILHIPALHVEVVPRPASDTSTVVEHSPYITKIQGSCPATAVRTGRDRVSKNLLPSWFQGTVHFENSKHILEHKKYLLLKAGNTKREVSLYH